MQTLSTRSTMRLSPHERADLSAQEAVIEEGLKYFERVGEALAHIQEKRLYREQFDSFSDYCRERWGKTRQWGYNLIQAYCLMQDISADIQQIKSNYPHLGITGDEKPANEWQVRTLRQFPKPLQPAIMILANQSADGKPTDWHIKEAGVIVQEMVAGYVEDDDGEQRPLHIVAQSRVVEGVYERLQRQKSHISQGKPERYYIAKHAQAEVSSIQSCDGLLSLKMADIDFTRILEGDRLHISIWIEGQPDE